MTATLYIDVTHTVAFGFRTGIQRVVRRIVAELVAQSEEAVVPVVAIGGHFHPLNAAGLRAFRSPGPEAGRGAMVASSSVVRGLALRLLRAVPAIYEPLQERIAIRRIAPLLRDLAEARAIEARPGDIVVLIDAFWGGTGALRAGRRLQAAGVRLVVVVYDLIPFTHPHFMPREIVDTFVPRMRRALAAADGALAISRHCAAEVTRFMGAAAPPTAFFYLGDDLDGVGVLRRNDPRSDGGFRYAMIGTVEPRKGHALVLDAFERRWAAGDEVALTVVGKMGWAEPVVVERLRRHAELGRRLRIVEDADDAALQAILASSDATIIASAIEGFGLPLVESLAADLPVIASDIPVFREIGGASVLTFAVGDGQALIDVMRAFERDPDRYREAARAFRWIDWSTAARQFRAAIGTVLRAASDRRTSRQITHIQR